MTMIKAMMWFENDSKKSFQVIIQEADEYQKKKYNISANLCYVNPKVLTDEIMVGDILVKPLRLILPNHYWLGIDKGDKK